MRNDKSFTATERINVDNFEDDLTGPYLSNNIDRVGLTTLANV